MPIKKIPNKIWAIQPEILEQYQKESIKLFMEEDRPIKDMYNSSQDQQVLVIRISGILEPNLSFMSFLYGGTSTTQIQQEIKKAINDDSISKIILELDTPGGEITGIQSLANTIYQARGKKEIIAVVKDLAASAGYWIASACSKIILASETAMVGSIGVVMCHKDFSEAEKKEGIVTTEIYAGKYKRLASNYKPLSEEGKNNLQKKVDYLYGIFLQDVVKYRNKDINYVLENMADGKVFIGKQAVSSQLVDGIELTDNFYMDGFDNSKNLGESYMPDAKDNIEITEEVFKEKNPKLSEMLISKAVLDGKKIGVGEGVLEERKRVLGIQALNVVGYEKTITKAIKEGYSIEKTGFSLWNAQKERGINIEALANENVRVDFKAVDEDTDEEKKKKEEDEIVGMMVGNKKEKK